MRRLIPVLWLLGCLVAPGAAWADEEQRISATGGMTVTWRGDPARGCAEHGMCDVRGSVVLDPSVDQGISGSGGGPGDFIPSIDVDLQPAIVRVVRGPASDPAGSCVDALGHASLTLFPDNPQARGPSVLVTPSVGFGEPLLSAGRCAGPTIGDLADAMPTLRVPRSAFRRPTQRFDLTFKRTLGAGPFTVDIDSAITATVRRRQFKPGRDDIPRTVRERVRVRKRAMLWVTYAIDASASPMAMSYSGLAGRGCELLDACGVSGRTTVGLAGGGEARVELMAIGPPALARGGGTRRALAALAAGRMRVETLGGDEPLRGRLDAEVRREGSAGVCRDGRDIDLPPLELDVGRSTSRVAVGGEDSGGNAGRLRTRCPGPAGRTSGALASGTLPTRALDDAQLTVPLALVAGDTWPFAATTAGTTTLTLRRVSARVRTARTPIG